MDEPGFGVIGPVTTSETEGGGSRGEYWTCGLFNEEDCLKPLTRVDVWRMRPNDWNSTSDRIGQTSDRLAMTFRPLALAVEIANRGEAAGGGQSTGEDSDDVSVRDLLSDDDSSLSSVNNSSLFVADLGRVADLDQFVRCHWFQAHPLGPFSFSVSFCPLNLFRFLPSFLLLLLFLISLKTKQHTFTKLFQTNNQVSYCTVSGRRITMAVGREEGEGREEE